MGKYGELIKQAKQTELSNSQSASNQLSNKQEAAKPETIKQDSYKKVAMRLSTEASERLKEWRLQTGLPYEILVDVLIRRVDELPTEYLQEAEAIRQQRLFEGKQKALARAQAKLKVT